MQWALASVLRGFNHFAVKMAPQQAQVKDGPSNLEILVKFNADGLFYRGSSAGLGEKLYTRKTSGRVRHDLLCNTIGGVEPFQL